MFAHYPLRIMWLSLVLLSLIFAPVTAIGQAAGVAQPADGSTWLIANDRFVFHPSLYGYSVQAFLDGTPSVLKNTTVATADGTATAAEVIEFYSYLYSINPQVLLTLLEMKQGLIAKPTAPPEEIALAMGNQDPQAYGFAKQVEWAAASLAQAFYAQPLAQVTAAGLPELRYETAASNALDAFVQQSPDISAASSGFDFPDVFEQLFGEVLEVSAASKASATAEPAWSLPWQYGNTWYYTSGPHSDSWGNLPYYNTRTSSPNSGLDFAPGGNSGCYESSSWISTMAPGQIVHSARSLILVEHSDGWSSYYYHVAGRDRRGTGRVNQGDTIGHPSCDAEYNTDKDPKPTGTHVHVARLYNGQFQPADRWNIGGWEVRSGSSNYNGTMVRNGVTKTANAVKTSVGNGISSENSVDSDGGDINIGQTRSGAINPAGDEDDFYFNAAAGQTITMRANATGGGLDPIIVLYNPSGSYITHNDDDLPNHTTNSRLVQSINTAGRYKIKVLGWGTTTGNYSIEVQASSPAAADPDDGRWIAQGQTLNGTINPDDDRDTYYFTGSAGTVVSVRMNRQGGALDSFLELYDNGGALIASNDDGGGNLNSLVVKSLPNTGTYRLAARSLNSRSSGSYSLSLATTYTANNNLALRSGATASSVEFSSYEAVKAVDGQLSTRWSSRFADNQFLIIDLGQARTFDKVILRWEAAYARIYVIAVPQSSNSWRQLYATGSGDGGLDTITFSPTTSRYIMLFAVQRGTPWGFSLFEFEVYNSATMLIPLVPPDDSNKEADTIPPLAPLAPIAEGKELMLIGQDEYAQENMPPLAETEIPEAPTSAVLDSVGLPYAEIIEPSEAAFAEAVGTGTLHFMGAATDNDENGDSIVAYEWRSDLNGVIGTSADFVLPLTALTEGTHVISLRVQDNEGNWAEAAPRTILVQHLHFVHLPFLQR